MTDKPHTPTLEQVEIDFVYAGEQFREGQIAERTKFFHRWLDQVRAEAKAEALREAADVFYDNNVIIDNEKYVPCHSCASIAQQYLDYRANLTKEQS